MRSIAASNKVVSLIQSQEHFDELFPYLFHKDRLVVMRAADAIEKVSAKNAGYLAEHKRAIIGLCKIVSDKELKWHLALLVSRIKLTRTELGIIWQLLTSWAQDKKESRIVRVNSIQGLFNLLQQNKELERDFNLLLSELEKHSVASLNARIRRFKNVK